MFEVNDRVQLRRIETIRYSREGTVIDINGKWITVRHDHGSKKGRGAAAVAPRFDYLADDLQHENPLLRFASEI